MRVNVGHNLYHFFIFPAPYLVVLCRIFGVNGKHSIQIIPHYFKIRDDKLILNQ